MNDRLSIVAVEAIPVCVSGKTEFRISEGGTRVHTSVILRILTEDEDLSGHGEIVCAPPGKPEELSQEILQAVREVVTPALVGLKVTDRNAACARVESALKERPWTKAAVNVALYDLYAKSLGIPVSGLLGGRTTDRIPLIGPVVGMMPPDKMAERAAGVAAQGYQTIKLKVGESVKVDVARVAAVREAVGSAIDLRVDANDHYTPTDAIRLVRAIEEFDIEHVEQPVPRRDILGMVEVRKAIGIPLMTDDMVATPRDAMTIIRLGAADRVKVKVTKHGLDGARLIIDMLAAAGLRGVLGHVFEMGLAGAAEAQIAATASNLAPPHEIGSMKPMGSDMDIIAQTLEPEPGFITLPTAPGLGVTLDWDKIDSIRSAD